jgi:hypothetical protein
METTPDTPANPYSAPVANLYGSTSGGTADVISPSTIAILSATKPWVRFLSVLMWIGVVLMLLFSAGMGVVSAMGVAKSPSTPFGGPQFLIFAVVYGVMAFIYIFPALKLWKYANRIKELSATRALATLDAALNEQRSFWKYAGIMMIILICGYIIFIVGMGYFFFSTAAMKAGAFPR